MQPSRLLQHLLLGLLLLASAWVSHAISHDAATPTSKGAAAGPGFQSIADIPGCSTAGSSISTSSALSPELQDCSWKVQMQRHASRWYAFDIPPDAADNMSVVIMARAVSGQITMALWGPGSDPYRSVPTQVGTNYMEWPGLRELDQDAAAARGGHASIASEQQYLFLTRKDKPLLVGQYVVVIQADMGQPLVDIQVSTPSSMTQLIAEEQEALKQLVSSCCPGLSTPSGQSGDSITTQSGWCSSVGHAVTYDLRQWYADICHVAPNVCDKEGHLQRLILPPYALRCAEFPKALGKFSRLRHLDISYSVAPGTLADVAAVVGQLSQLQQLHLSGVGLKGRLTCELVDKSKSLVTLQLSDNDNLEGSMPSCFLASQSLQELQLAGLSRLRGGMPQLPPAAATPAAAGRNGARRALQDSPEEPCGLGKLQWVNLAGVIGDQEPGLTGRLPALESCKNLLYLDLSGHALSGPLPAPPTELQFLNLSSNGLSRKLPELSSSPHLQYIDLSFNRFSGAIGDLASLPSLDWLDLSDNELEGPLPSFPVSLRWIDLSNNRFTGGLDLSPTQSKQDRLLVLLNLSGNRLTGPLSPTLANAVPHLSFLDLSHNGLSGTLEAFAAALKPNNQLLQINLSYNRFSGQVPDQLQILAAVRPVVVTMKDGYTPVHRIFDLSHNDLAGAFPVWLITSLPLLMSTCKCTVGISLDGDAFSCPAVVARANRKAQEILHSFEYLQCVSSTATGKQQQVPIWQLAGPSYSYVSREQRKQQLAQLEEQHVHQHHGLSGGAIAGIVLAVVGAAVLAAAVALAIVRRRRSNNRENKAIDALLQHYDPYQHALDVPLGAGPSFGTPTSGSPTAASVSSAVSHRSSQSGDGMCEIALVMTAPGSARLLDAAGPHGSAAKSLSKDGMV